MATMPDKKPGESRLTLDVDRGEWVMIGGDVTVFVEKSTSSHTRLVITAPRTVPVIRSDAVKTQPVDRGQK